MKRIVLIVFLFSIHTTYSQTLVPMPDTLSGTNFNLTVHKDSVQFLSGKKTMTYGINSMHYLGPTLLLKKGDSININVNNEIGDTTTMHWHGLHVSAKNDGGPYSMIMDGMSWNPGFVVRNRAAFYWYHSHMMMKTGAQVTKGEVGMIIVRDNAEAALNLPRRYGVDDFPLVLQSLELDTSHQFVAHGLADSLLFVNGVIDSPYTNMPAQVVRMRFVNGSVARTFNLGFTGNMPFKVIGNDNGLLQASVSTTRIELSPGERAEILLDLGGLMGQKIYLMSYASELPDGVMGGPTMPNPPPDVPMNSPLSGVDFNIMKILISTPTTAPVTTIPTTLIPDTPYSVAAVNGHRTLILTADTPMMIGMQFYINHQTYDMERIDYRIPLNNTEIWTVIDSDANMMAHPFHIHGVHFYILDRDGNPPGPTEIGRKDVVLVHPYETVRVITRFDDFEDTTTPYMYHCHMLNHEDGGMMGQFVVGANYDAVKTSATLQNKVKVFPNPANDIIYITIGNMEPAELVISDAIGRIMYTGTIVQKATLYTTDWGRGVYFISVKQNGQIIREKCVVE